MQAQIQSTVARLVPSPSITCYNMQQLCRTLRMQQSAQTCAPLHGSLQTDRVVLSLLLPTGLHTGLLLWLCMMNLCRFRTTSAHGYNLLSSCYPLQSVVTNELSFFNSTGPRQPFNDLANPSSSIVMPGKPWTGYDMRYAQECCNLHCRVANHRLGDSLR
jgi:hypothetical protein